MKSKHLYWRFSSRLVSFLMVLGLSCCVLATSHATASTSVIALPCTPPKVKPKNTYSLSLASTIAQVTSVEWGIRAGCFKKYGIDLKWTAVPSSAIAIAGLVGGSHDIVIATPTNLVLAQGNGGINVKIIAPRHIYSTEELRRARTEPLYPGELLLQTALLTTKNTGINSWQDLSGKKIGVQSLVGGDSAGILLAMKSVGALSDKTQFVSLSTSQMESSLMRGNVDAVVASDPFATSIISNGGKVIGYPVAFFQEAGPTVVYASLQSIVSANRPAFLAFKKAILEMNHLENLPENSDSIKSVIAELTDVDLKTLQRVNLPTMGETQVKFSELAYIPRNLKLVGFLQKRVDITPILEW